jgi:hypothetical protein
MNESNEYRRYLVVYCRIILRRFDTPNDEAFASKAAALLGKVLMMPQAGSGSQ